MIKIVTQVDGSTEHWKDGQLHREDGPAVDIVNGQKSHYRHGKLHNEKGPAIVWPVGCWTYPEGAEYYFLDGVWYPKWLFTLAANDVAVRWVTKLFYTVISKLIDGFGRIVR